MFRCLLLLLIAMPTDVYSNNTRQTVGHITTVTKVDVACYGPPTHDSGGAYASATDFDVGYGSYFVSVNSVTDGNVAGILSDANCYAAADGTAANSVGDVTYDGGLSGADLDIGPVRWGGGGGGGAGPSGPGGAGSDADGLSAAPGGTNGGGNAGDGGSGGTSGNNDAASGSNYGGAPGHGADDGGGGYNSDGSPGQARVEISYAYGTLEKVQDATNTAVGAVISPAITVTPKDTGGVVDTADVGAATVSILSGPGSFGGGSTLAQAYSSGVATFNDLTLDTAGTYVLRFTDNQTGVTVDTSSFTVTAPTVTNTGGTLSMMGVG